MDELETERYITIEILSNLGFKPICFEEDSGIADPGEESVKLMSTANILVLILWKRFSNIVKKEYEAAVIQDKPIIILEKELRNMEMRDTELIQFLSEISKKHTFKKFRLPNSLTKVIKSGIQNVFDECLKTIIKLPNDEIYQKIQWFLNSAQEVCCVSRTPILIFGPRDYLTKNKVPNELIGYKITNELKEAAIRGERKYSLIISSHLIINEIKNNNNSKDLSKIVLTNLISLLNARNNTFKIVATSSNSEIFQYLTFIIADNNLILWIKSPLTNHCIISTKQELILAFQLLADQIIKKDNGTKDLEELIDEIKKLIKDER